MIELSDVVKVYPMGTTEVRAMDGVSLRIEQGEFVAIVGASGSGKSTMMHLIGCLDRPTSGTYRLLGETISALGDRSLARIRNRHIGFVFQTFNLISRMSAWENVAVPLFYARETVTKPRAMEALDRVGLADRARHAPNELSGGERQRVAIARAIVNRPPLILADEPTGNLDTRTGEQIMEIFRDLHKAGTTVVLVTHERDIADQAQRIVNMRDGRIVDDVSSSSAGRAFESMRKSRQGGDDDRTAGPDEPVAPTPVTPAAEPDGDTEQSGAVVEARAAATAVLHPNAKRALIWTLLGPACLLGLFGGRVLVSVLREVNPTVAGTVGTGLSLALVVMMFVAPILGIVNGRRGARWVRLAPAKYTGLRRAVAAQWLGGVHLIVATLLIVLFVIAMMMRARGMMPPR